MQSGNMFLGFQTFYDNALGFFITVWDLFYSLVPGINDQNAQIIGVFHLTL